MDSGVVLHLSERGMSVAGRAGGRGTPAVGQVLTAIVTSLAAGRLTLETQDGFVFWADEGSLSASVGEELRFEVLEGGKGGALKLRHLEEAASGTRRTTEAMQVASLRGLLRAGGMYSEAREAQDEDAERLNKLRAIAAIRRQVAAGRSLAPQVVAQLSHYGLSLEKLGFDAIIGIMNDIGIRQAKILSEAEAREAVAAYTEGPHAQFSRQEALLEALARHGVPLSDENIAAASHAMEVFAASASLTEGAMVRLLREGQPLSISNIYSASFSTAPRPNGGIGPEELLRLSTAIDEFFAHMGISNTPENHELALFMISHDLDITPESLDRLALLNTIASPTAQEEVAQRIAYAMSLGRPPLTAPLDQPMPAPNAAELMVYYQELRAELPILSGVLSRMPDEAIEAAVREGISIADIRLAHARMVRPQASASAVAAIDAYQRPREGSAARLVLEQIRIKLSFEAAQMLAAKGIDIDTMPLFQALESVKAAQREAMAQTPSLPPIQAAGSWQAAGPQHAHTQPSTDGVELMIRTADALFQMRPPGPLTLGGLALRRHEGLLTSGGMPAEIPADAPNLTISSIAARTAMERLGAGYEQFQTTINPRLGDSFNKIRAQFAPLLIGLGIKASSSNIAAAEILTKNNIDITPESVAAVKRMEREVAFVAQRLHPVIASSIIREGLNPLDMHLDDITSYINSFNDEYGISDSQRIAAHIAQMDRERAIGPEERERLIAFYRVLNQVARDGSAALGLLHNTDTPLTLGNMLNAATYYQGTKGGRGLLSLHTDTESRGLSQIRSSLLEGALVNHPKNPEAGFSGAPETHPENLGSGFSGEHPQVVLDSLIAKELAHTLNPGVLSAVLRDADGGDTRSLEDIIQQEPLQVPRGGVPSGAGAEQAYAYEGLNAAQEHFARVFSTPPRAIYWLQQSGLGASPTHMAGVSALLQDQFYIGRELERIRRRIESSEDEADEGTEALREFLDGLGIDAMSSYTPEAAQAAISPHPEMTHLLGAIRVKSAASTLQSGADYSYPVRLHDGISTLNIFVINPEAVASEEGRALIALSTSSLGDVSAHATLHQGDTVSLHIGAGRALGLSRLQQHADILSGALEEAGFKIGEISFAGAPEPAFHALDNAMDTRPLRV